MISRNFGLRGSRRMSGRPSTPSTATSPSATWPPKTQNDAFRCGNTASVSDHVSTAPTSTKLNTTGMSAARMHRTHDCAPRPRPSHAVHSAASSVASEPKTTSKMPAALSRLAIAQPANSPHAVQGMKNGKMHSTSETRHWIAP